MNVSSIAAVAKRSLIIILLLAMVPGAGLSFISRPCDKSKSNGDSIIVDNPINRDTLSLTFTGDVLLDRGVRIFIENVGADKLFSKSIDSLFRSSDIVVANLECPVTKIKSPMQKLYIFRGEPEWLPVLKRHGVTHLNLANNHSVDQGRRGLADTWQQVIEAGMVPVGAGENLAEAAKPVLLANEPRPVYLVPSLQLALENFAYLPDRFSVSQESMDSLVSRVSKLRQDDPSAYIIVTLHWGGEHTMTPLLQQKKDARRLIDAGADVLIGHHTHTLQTIEQYRGHTIYYSIGNFIFDQKKPFNIKACAVNIKITDSGASIATLPLIINNCVPKIAYEEL